ncbi:hypothetical protein F5878DRAFT_603956 [Lentinula raphanica]|uniref:Uncharacterized protein n=1 Tax=Lentinula raphanica TaxID=153919 RepID=A0AA38UJ81_9AGAR|nr:hypothetical protein F5878DRAFT_603956 [Lentinula raphanica]
MDTPHPAGVPSPAVVDGTAARSLDGHNVLEMLFQSRPTEVYGPLPHPEDVFHTIKAIAPGQWKKDMQDSKNLAAFMETQTGNLYADTDKLLETRFPLFSRSFLQSMILLELFEESTLRPEALRNTLFHSTITQNGYATLTEFTPYKEDTHQCKNFRDFETTRSGRFFHRLSTAITSAQWNYSFKNLRYLVGQDIRGLTSDEEKAYDFMPEVLGNDWDPVRKKSTLTSESILFDKWEAAIWTYYSFPPQVQKELKKIRDETFKACWQ